MGEIARNLSNLHDQDTGKLTGYVNPVTGQREALDAVALQALVSGAGMSWASLPAASSVPGMIVPISDFPTMPLFRSDGTRWRPVNGYATIWNRCGSISQPVATLTANGSAARFTLPDDTTFPSGMLAPGSRIAVSARVRRLGASGALGYVYVRLGNHPTFSNNNNLSGNSMAPVANNDQWVFAQAAIDIATRYSVSGYLVPGGSVQVGAAGDRTGNFDVAGLNYLSIDISTATVDQFALLDYLIGIYA